MTVTTRRQLLRMNTCCKAVIFDLDGTLLDTIKDLGSSMNCILEKYGFPTKEEQHYVRAIGNGLRNLAKRSFPESAVTDELLDKTVPEFIEHYGDHCMEKTVVYEGINELLEFCTKNNILLSILSNKRDDLVKELTPHYFPDYEFRYAMGELSQFPRKPDPTSALYLAEMLGVSPSDILFVGDSIYDIRTGKNAGMKTLAVTWGYQPKEQLVAENPDFIADSPAQIIEYIKDFK